MPTSVECICRHELPQVHDLIDDASAVCITKHPGFNSVCLNIWVLQAAYYIYRQHYGTSARHGSVHSKPCVSILNINNYV